MGIADIVGLSKSSIVEVGHVESANFDCTDLLNANGIQKFLTGCVSQGVKSHRSLSKSHVRQIQGGTVRRNASICFPKVVLPVDTDV